MNEEQQREDFNNEFNEVIQQQEHEEAIVEQDKMVNFESGYGPMAIRRSQFNLWQRYGWPEEGVLFKMAKAYAEHGDANRTD